MSALRHPRFRRLLIGESVSSFGDTAMFLSLGVWAKDLTGSNTAAGLVFLFLTGPQLAAPLLGHLADRVRRRSLMIWSNVFGIALVLSLLGVSGRNDLWRLYVVAVGYALLASVPARSGLVKDLLPSDDAASGQSLLSSIGRVPGSCRPSSVRPSTRRSAVARSPSSTPPRSRSPSSRCCPSGSPSRRSKSPRNRSVEQITAGFRYVHATRLLWQLTIALTAFLAVAGLLETGLFAAIQYGIHRPPSFYGVLLSVQGAGTIAGAVLASKVVKAIGEARTTGIGAIGAGVGLALGIVAPSVPTFLIGMFVCGASLGLMFVAFGTAQQLYTPGRLTGRVGAAMGTLMSLSQTISIAIGATVVAFIDWRLMFGLTALTGLVCGLVLSLRPAPTPAIVASIADEPLITPSTCRPSRSGPRQPLGRRPRRRPGSCPGLAMIHHRGRSASLQRPQSSTPVDHPRNPRHHGHFPYHGHPQSPTPTAPTAHAARREAAAGRYARGRRLRKRRV